jgi:hypothetical protein
MLLSCQTDLQIQKLNRLLGLVGSSATMTADTTMCY